MFSLIYFRLSNDSRSIKGINYRSLLADSRAKIDIFSQRFKIIHQVLNNLNENKFNLI